MDNDFTLQYDSTNIIDVLKKPDHFNRLATIHIGTQVPGPFTSKRFGFNFSSRISDCGKHTIVVIIEEKKFCFTSLARLMMNQSTVSLNGRFSCSTLLCVLQSVFATRKKNGLYCRHGSCFIKEIISLVCPPEPNTIITLLFPTIVFLRVKNLYNTT